MSKIEKMPVEELVYLWGNTFPLFNAESAIGYSILNDILGAKSELIFYIKDNYKISFGKKKLLDRAYKYGDLFLKKDEFEKHKKKMKDLFLKREKFIKAINNKDLSKLTNEDLFKYIEEYSEIFKRIFGHMAISRPECADHLSKNLLSLILKQVKDNNKANKDFSILVTSTKLDIIKKEKIDKLKLLNNSNENNLRKHVLKYPWLYGYMYSPEDAIKKLSEDIKKEKKAQLKKEVDSFIKELRKLRRQKNNLLKKYNKNIALLSERLSFLGHNRLEIKSRFAGLLVVVSPLFEEIYRRTEVKPKIIADKYFIDDIKKLLLENRKLTKKEIEKRRKVILYSYKNKIHYLLDKDSEKFYNKYLKKYLESKDVSVKGITASKGRVSGKCRVMKLKENMDLSKFKKGEILITEMTAPHMVSVMAKSVGVITNEGGIMSHAAVISREFNIPCIVGTGNATEIFKTGDYVELDANKGFVKIIKK